MLGFVRASSVITSAAALCLMAGAAVSDAPKRVVSMNLCTDQLAMLLAAPGQLISVTELAQDPRSSSMAAEAAKYRANTGVAEDVFLLDPDLVVAGTYNAGPTLNMLERLGIPVVKFQPATALEEIPGLLHQMGEVLGRADAADDAARRFSEQLANLRMSNAGGPRAALYFSQSYTAGDKTLAGQILATSGFLNIADEYDLSRGGTLPLELLVLSAPDVVVTGRPYEGYSEADAVMSHPVLAKAGTAEADALLTSREWVCGTPHVLNAVENMVAARRLLDGGG